ncbi:zf-C2H2 4 and zf-C2H2 domain containing protein [Trichuris trichiura]|uniref:Zf-C2H2 4 and zf-C2H2 domain containing protein n=1 Tax=Trichuris trichiura TaxID=36087 RepID=A0A077Z300_TRITR|nr:zf-C2H2 4 and zf-C2H2 domain containing protein [Trichuris trichiura]
MWDDCISPSLQFKEANYELRIKSPFNDEALANSVRGDTSPFSNIFTSEMLRESDIAFNTSEDSAGDAGSETTRLKFCENVKAAEGGNSESQPMFVCQFCPFSTQNRKNFMVHKRKHAGVKSFSCGMCSAKFTRNYSLKKHLREKHNPHVTTALPKYCPFSSCNYVTRNPNALQVHRRNQHANVYFCKQCNARYAFRRSLLHHLTFNHASDASLIGINAVQTDNAQEEPIDESNEVVDAPEQENGVVETQEMENSVTTEYRCEKCGFNASTLRGLYHHKRFKHATKKRSQTGPQSARKRTVAQKSCDNLQTQRGHRLLEAAAPISHASSLPRTRSSTRETCNSNPASGQSVRQNDYPMKERVDKCSHIYVRNEKNLNGQCEGARSRIEFDCFALNGNVGDSASHSSSNQSPISDCFPGISSVGWAPTQNETGITSPQPSRCGNLDGESQLVEMAILNDVVEFSESADLTTCVGYLQETNTRILNLYRRKRNELQRLRRLTTEFFHRMLPEHPITRKLHAWKNIDRALEDVLNAQNAP